MKTRMMITASALLFLAGCGSADEAPKDNVAADTTAAEPAAAPQVAASAAPQAPGKTLFIQCAACHTVEAGGPNRVGPNLAGIVGKKAASHEGFSYSAAMKQKAPVWDEATLNEFLKHPQAFVPGTSMAFAGVRNDDQRKALIEYLKSN